MEELSNYELCLLIHLCYKRSKKLYKGFLPSSQEANYNTWLQLADAVNGYCKAAVITVNKSFIKQGGTLSEQTVSVIKLNNKSLLEKFLDDYCSCLEHNTLESVNDINFETQVSQFKQSINKTKKFNEYYIDKTQYIPVILWGLRKEYITLKDINNFTLFPNKEEIKRIPVIERKRRKISQNEFDFNILIDVSKFMEIAVSNTRCANNDDSQDSTKNKFTKSDKYLLKLAKERLESANEVITSEDIEKIYSKDDKDCITPLNIRISNNVNKLNIRFNNITGKNLIERQTKSYMTVIYDIIATIEDINIALKSSK